MNPLSTAISSPLGRYDLVGMGVTAETVVGLEEGHVVAALEEIGGGEAGDAGSDDGNDVRVAASAHLRQWVDLVVAPVPQGFPSRLASPGRRPCPRQAVGRTGPSVEPQAATPVSAGGPAGEPHSGLGAFGWGAEQRLHDSSEAG